MIHSRFEIINCFWNLISINSRTAIFIKSVFHFMHHTNFPDLKPTKKMLLPGTTKVLFYKTFDDTRFRRHVMPDTTHKITTSLFFMRNSCGRYLK